MHGFVVIPTCSRRGQLSLVVVCVACALLLRGRGGIFALIPPHQAVATTIERHTNLPTSKTARPTRSNKNQRQQQQQRPLHETKQSDTQKPNRQTQKPQTAKNNTKMMATQQPASTFSMGPQSLVAPRKTTKKTSTKKKDAENAPIFLRSKYRKETE